jgi:hypothetical protein
MNGYGHFLLRERWYEAYWGGAALLLIVLSLLFWARGTNDGWRQRLQLARHALTMPVLATIAVGVLIFAGAGGVLFYNQYVADCYKSAYHKEAEKASYERKYKQYAVLPQPRITDVKLNVDIWPEQRALIVKGRYTLQNKTTQPVTDIIVTQDNSVAQYHVRFSQRCAMACRTARWASTATSWPRRWRRAPAGHGFRTQLRRKASSAWAATRP